MTEKQMTTQNQADKPLQTAVPLHRSTPPVDIYETSEELLVLADVPGVTEENLQIEVDRQILTIEGQSQPVEGEAKLNYYRQFQLPEVFDGTAAEANLKDGVLHLRLPKTEAAKPRKIAVKTLH